MSLAFLAGVLALTAALGHGAIAALAAVLVGFAWIAKGRDGILVSALFALGSLPYLAFVMRLGAGA